MPTEEICSNCRYADFGSNQNDSVFAGQSFCRWSEYPKATWYPRLNHCDKGRFAPETNPVKLAKRKELFERVDRRKAAKRAYWAEQRKQQERNRHHEQC